MTTRRVAFAAVLASLPRTPISYGAYVLAPLLLVANSRPTRAMVHRAGLIVLYGALSLTISEFRGNTSLTSFILEMVLLLPLILFMAGFVPRLSQSDALMAMRLPNLILAAMSLPSIAIRGVPHLSVSPDYWNGLYGLGGAQILTVVGFFGLLVELQVRQSGGRPSKLALATSLVNFVVPSYLVGVIAGIVALILGLGRRLRIGILVVIAALPLTLYVTTDRAASINTSAYERTGQQPKVFAYMSALSVVTAWSPLGAGPGQLHSTPQTWLDPNLSAVGSQRVPELPWFTMSDVYSSEVAPYTEASAVNRYALSSSFNKPTSGWAALLGEWGLVALPMAWMLLRRLFRDGRRSPLGISAIFVVLVNVGENWFDQPWLAYCLFALVAVRNAFVEAHPQLLDSGRAGGIGQPA